MQTEFNSQNTTDASLYETKLITSGTLGIYYSNSDFPASSLNVLTVNYYDNYTFDKTNLGTIPTSVQSQTINQNIVKGLSTGSKVKVLETSNWITTATYYDNNARAIYTTSDNAYLDTEDKAELKLDFRGKVTKSKSNHVKGTNTAIVIEEDFDYDNMERLLTHKHKKDALDQETLTDNTYDELGQLTSKGVGNASSSSTRLQTVNYDYNIRGWLTKINDPVSLGSDLFAFGISYDNIVDDVYNQVHELYNGNISETFWRTANDDYLRGYGYNYDALNRLTDAWYEEPNHPDFLANNDRIKKYPGFYDIRFTEYDKNGNIDYYRRSGQTAQNTSRIIDRMTYTYEPNSNKLISVSDGTDANDEGFNDGNTSGNDYAYDNNGNMTKDLNKGIGTISTNGITYNHLNLPTLIDFGSNNKIEYFYDAMGVKLKKEVTDSGTTITTEYVGNYIYENGTLQFFGTDEGYVTPDGSGGFDYVYQYLDHLGNVRISYSDSDGNGSVSTSEIIEESNYYPFGLKHEGYNSNISSNGNSTAQKFKYNGIELEESLGLNLYEMDVRSYDPAIGRFTSIDPVIHYEFSTYNAFDNNPAFWADPSGAYSTREWMKDNWITDENVTTIYQAPSDDNSDDSNDENNEDCCGGLVDLVISYLGIGKKFDEMSNGTGQTNYSQEEIDSRDESRKFEALKSATINKPDALGVDVNLSLGAWAGGDHTFSAIWILNGGSKSSYPYVFYSAQGHVSDGADFSLTIGGSIGNYQGTKTNSVDDISGSFYSGELGLGLGGGGNIIFTRSYDEQGRKSWTFGSVNFGVGLNLSPVSGANIKAGTGNTKAIFNY